MDSAAGLARRRWRPGPLRRAVVVVLLMVGSPNVKAGRSRDVTHGRRGRRSNLKQGEMSELKSGTMGRVRTRPWMAHVDPQSASSTSFAVSQTLPISPAASVLTGGLKRTRTRTVYPCSILAIAPSAPAQLPVKTRTRCPIWAWRLAFSWVISITPKLLLAGAQPTPCDDRLPAKLT